jgi:hypothetical protein
MEEFEVVRRGRPTVAPPSPESVRIGRALLVSAIAEEASSHHRNQARRRHRSQRYLAWAVLAAAAAVAALVLTVAPFQTVPAAQASPVEVVTSEKYVDVRFVDLSATDEDIEAAINDAGLDIVVDLVPVSPSLVGNLVGIEDTALRETDWDFLNPSASGGAPTLRLLRGSVGGLAISVGRPATGDEVYVVAAEDAELPGEILHCTDVLLSTGGHAADIAAERGITVTWFDTTSQQVLSDPLPDPFRNRYVVSTRPTGPAAVYIELAIEPVGARQPSYQEDLGANCPPEGE